MLRRDPLEIIEGLYVAQIANHFYRHGIFEHLNGTRTSSQLARKYKYDDDLFAALLAFLYETTNLLKRNQAGNYSLNAKFHQYYFLGFQFDKFIGSYGPAFAHLDKSLRSQNLGRRFVNRKVQAKAYKRINSPPNAIVIQLVRQLELRSLLDLGCGPATLLTELCLSDPMFQGWGIDESTQMCKVARERVKKAQLTDRIYIINGDARRLGSHLRPRDRSRIQALQSKGLFNELFRHGDRQATDYLRMLKKLFSGRLLFVVDYYGKLSHVSRIKTKYRHTLIHDIVQVVSAQGIPPPDLAGWAAIYLTAGCQLVHAYEGDNQGVEWFVHLVRL